MKRFLLLLVLIGIMITLSSCGKRNPLDEMQLPTTPPDIGALTPTEPPN